MRIAVCLIVRNEVGDIAEWLAYHATAGFDAFLVYEPVNLWRLFLICEGRAL
jgi:hypothetical protein